LNLLVKQRQTTGVTTKTTAKITATATATAKTTTTKTTATAKATITRSTAKTTTTPTTKATTSREWEKSSQIPCSQLKKAYLNLLREIVDKVSGKFARSRKRELKNYQKLLKSEISAQTLVKHLKYPTFNI
jgi:hypothetical protein